MRKENLFFLIAFLIFVGLQKSGNAQIPDSLKGANPFTSGHYIPGIWDIRDYATPAPGFYVLDYNVFLTSDKFFNIEGNQVTEIARTNGKVNLNVDIGGYITVPTLFYASPFKILGGTYLAGLSIPYSTVNLDLGYDAIARIFRDTITKSGTITGGSNGFSDMTFTPFGLSWASNTLNLTAMYSLVAPTGRYTPGATDNVGLGYWTNTFQAMGYVYPMKIKGQPSQAMAVMAALTYEMNSKINGVNVTPGNRLTVEYGISQYLSERLEIGFMGGYNFQITEDKGTSVWWNQSDLDQVGYASFLVGGWPIANRLYTALKYNIDYGMKQRIKNEMYLLNIIYETGWLTGKKQK